MSDIVERLIDAGPDVAGTYLAVLLHDAKVEIERLQSNLQGLREERQSLIAWAKEQREIDAQCSAGEAWTEVIIKLQEVAE